MAKVVQISVGGFDKNFSYLVIGEKNHSKEAVLIDPTGDLAKIEGAIQKNDVEVKLLLSTHAHPDHVELLEHFKGKKIPYKNFEELKKCAGRFDTCGFEMKIIFVPGHTKDSVCYIVGKNIFTGDTLFVRGIGTTAYGGNEEELFKSLTNLATLNGELLLWPGHDYGGTKSTLKEALNNTHIAPSKETLEKIKKKVEKYESKKPF
ncbi:MAG: MBL fold metallo-hydrolase [archaeon]